jgi:hemerythrin
MTYTYTKWDPDLATGHNIIDTQHQQLIAAVNALFDAHREGKGPKAVEQTMDFLVAYTIKHFGDEEKIQEKAEYPHYRAHKLLHDGFKGEAQDLAAALRRDGPTDEFISHVCVTIGRWVINHIKSEDFKMAAHVKSREHNA